MSRALAWLALGWLAGGCALQPGGWFAALEPSLTASFVTARGRDAGEGWQKLDTSHQARITRAVVELAPIVLEKLTTEARGTGERLDPAHPPPGYTLCHNGHCHHVDGRLVSYEDIEAELAGGGEVGRSEPVVALRSDPLDVLAGTQVDLSCEPVCGLPRGAIHRAQVAIRRVVLEGAVRDPRPTPSFSGEVAFRWDSGASAEEPLRAVSLPLSLDVPDDAFATFALAFELQASAPLLDGVDWAALIRSHPIIDIGPAQNAAAHELLRDNLEALSLTVTSTEASFTPNPNNKDEP